MQWVFKDPEDTTRFAKNQRTGQPTFPGSIFDTRGTGPDGVDDIPDLISEDRGNNGEDSSRNSWEGAVVWTDDGRILTEGDSYSLRLQRAIEESLAGAAGALAISKRPRVSEEQESRNEKQGEQEGLDNKTDTTSREDAKAARDQEWDEFIMTKYMAWQKKKNTPKGDRTYTKAKTLVDAEAERIAGEEEVPQVIIEEWIEEWNKAKPAARVLEEHYAGLVRRFRGMNSVWSGTRAQGSKDKEEEGLCSIPDTSTEHDFGDDGEVDEDTLLDEEEATRIATENSRRDQGRRGGNADDRGEASGSGNGKGKQTEREERAG